MDRADSTETASLSVRTFFFILFPSFFIFFMIDKGYRTRRFMLSSSFFLSIKRKRKGSSYKRLSFSNIFFTLLKKQDKGEQTVL